MVKLLKEDVNHIVSKLPEAVIDVMRKFHLYLTGGFIRAIIAGEDPHDIDLYGSTKERLESAAEFLHLYKYSPNVKKFETSNTITVVDMGRLPVQFVTRWLFDDPIKLNNTLDLTIAQAVVWYDNQNWESTCSNLFYCDLASKNLRYSSIEMIKDAGSCILRVINFLRKGYHITPEELSKVIYQLLRQAKEYNVVNPEMIANLIRRAETWYLVDGCEVRHKTKENTNGN